MGRTHRWLAMTAIVSTTAASTLLMIPGASAQAPDTTAAEATATVRTIDDVAPGAVTESGADSTRTRSDGSTVTSEGRSTIVVSDDADRPVSIASVGTPTVTMLAALPGDGGGRVVDGATVFDAKNASVTYQPVDADAGGGVRALFTLEGPNAPKELPVTFGIPAGAQLVALEGGGVEARDASGQRLGALPAPWAIDSSGAAVPTRYEIRGTTVIQHVAPTAATVWPVVADPFWIPAWAVYRIIRCGFGSYIGWIAAAGWNWWNRAVALIGGCVLALP